MKFAHLVLFTVLLLYYTDCQLNDLVELRISTLVIWLVSAAFYLPPLILGWMDGKIRQTFICWLFAFLAPFGAKIYYTEQVLLPGAYRAKHIVVETKGRFFIRGDSDEFFLVIRRGDEDLKRTILEEIALKSSGE